MRYGEYKILEMLWNKRIPQHWQTVPLCSIATEKSICNCNELPLLSVYLDNGVVPFEKMGTKRTNATSKDVSKYQRVDPGDFVLNNQQAWRGSVGVSDYTGIVSPAYVILSMDDTLNRRYANYLMRSSFMIDQFYIVSKGVGSIQRNIYWPEFKRSIVPVPPREEQEQIVRYLDWKVSKINKLIHGYQKQIKLLEEQKMTKIDRIVRTGLNPNVPMKDSGIEYLGNVPNHWTVLQNHRLFKSMNRKFEENETVLSLSQKDGLIPYNQMTERSLHTASYDNWQLVMPNDLVLNRFKAHLGVFFASQYRGISTFHYGVYEPKMKIISKYYEALYHTAVYRRVYAGQSKGMTVGLQNLSDIDYYTVYTLLPPYDEQQQIVDKIKCYEEEYLTVKNNIEHEIELLKEYRTRLISDVVTGQMDVRGIEVPDYIPEEDIDETVEENKDAEVDTDAESDQ